MLALYTVCNWINCNRNLTTGVYQQLDIMVLLTEVIFHQKVGCGDIRGTQSLQLHTTKSTLKSAIQCSKLLTAIQV